MPTLYTAKTKKTWRALSEIDKNRLLELPGLQDYTYHASENGILRRGDNSAMKLEEFLMILNAAIERDRINAAERDRKSTGGTG